MIWFNDRFHKNQKGQTLVEFALILPIIIIILFGITEFGRIFYSYLVITNAARQGARYGAVVETVRKSNEEIRQKVREVLPDSIKIPNDDDISIEPKEKDARIPGVPLRVEVTYKVDLITPIVLGKDTITLKSKAVMRVE